LLEHILRVSDLTSLELRREVYLCELHTKIGLKTHWSGDQLTNHDQVSSHC
jgi:hypothetical protein